jgi:hypothetical protein
MEKQKVELMGGDVLQDAMTRAVLAGAMPGSEQEPVASGSTLAAEKQAVSEQKPWNPRSGQKKPAVSPLSGAPTPPGRPLGVKNKLTNLRDAVLEAFDKVGGAEYLVRLAEGTQSDRAAFTSLVAKVLPTQINQNVEGGIKLELSWLGGRSIGATTAQLAEQRTQVLDLERDSEGSYRIKDPASAPMGVAEGVSPMGGSAAGAGGGIEAKAQSSAGDAQGRGA